MLRLTFVVLCCALLFAGGCGGGGGSAGTPAASELERADVTVRITAHNNEFSQDTITVPAGAHVTIELESEDAAPHNVAVYARTPDGEDEEIFAGETIYGPGATTTGGFDAPAKPGDYFFRCDVHPDVSVGQFIVQ